MLCGSPRLPSLDLFLDENIQSLGPELESHPGAGRIIWVGHHSVPDLPLETKDIPLLQAVGHLGFLFVTRDRRMLSRPPERKQIYDACIRMVLITARGHHQLFLSLIVKYWKPLVEVDATAVGPCLHRLNQSGVHQADLPAYPTARRLPYPAPRVENDPVSRLGVYE